MTLQSNRLAKLESQHRGNGKLHVIFRTSPADTDAEIQRMIEAGAANKDDQFVIIRTVYEKDSRSYPVAGHSRC